jgi:hypothetical protein
MALHVLITTKYEVINPQRNMEGSVATVLVPCTTIQEAETIRDQVRNARTMEGISHHATVLGYL